MKKNVETRVVGTLDEVLFGEIPSTCLYSDPQEFQEAKDIFKNAEIGKEFGGTVYWQEWMFPQALAEQTLANDAFHAYRGANAERIAILRQAVLNADFLVNWLKGIVDDAKHFPRPIFQK